MRIFTTAYEMPFAGHPTLGTAHVVAGLAGGAEAVTLHVPAGAVPVEHAVVDGLARWTLTTAVAPQVRPPDASRAQVAAMLGLRESDLGDDPLLVDTGVEQLVVPLASVEAVHGIAPVAGLLAAHGRSRLGEAQVQVWAASGPDTIEARFVLVEGSGVVEDPATGSACANLGGWFVARGAHTDGGLHLTLSQGAAVQRPSRLVLDVDPEGRIRVSGTVLEVGRGSFHLPDESSPVHRS